MENDGKSDWNLNLVWMWDSRIGIIKNESDSSIWILYDRNLENVYVYLLFTFIHKILKTVLIIILKLLSYGYSVKLVRNKQSTNIAPDSARTCKGQVHVDISLLN